MNLSQRKVAVALLVSLTAITIVCLVLCMLKTQAAGALAGNFCGVAKAQDESLSHDWSVTTVDACGIAGWYTSLALEPTAPYFPHISYYASFPNYDLDYASWNRTGWVTTTVDSKGVVGYYSSVALEPTPPYTPHISYYHYTDGDLRHAWLSGAVWLSETVDSEGNVGSYTSLALEPTAPYVPHISYYDITNGDLKHAWLSGTLWLSETVDSEGTVGWYSSLALEPTPPYTPHISYRDVTNRAVKYAYLDENGWVSRTVDTDGSVGWYTSLALEPAPPYNPHISYFDRTSHALKHAYSDRNEWVSNPVDYVGSVGWYSSLALETTAPYVPHISYYDFTNGDLKHVWLSNAGWLSETVDSEGNVGRHTSIDLVAAAASYTICISYYDDTHDALKLACTEIAKRPLTVTKRASSDPVPAGGLLTYILTANNTGGADATGVVITDALPANTRFLTASHGGLEESGMITWTNLAVPIKGSLPITFAVTVPCTVGTSITNDSYRVVTSAQGIASDWGAPVTTMIEAPAINASFYPASICTCPNRPITFADTSTTNGGPIITRCWNFGDGRTEYAPTVVHSYTTSGTYTITLTVTDTCGFRQTKIVTNAVRVGCCVYLPVITREQPDRVI
jgi:uncharacterized repeat protein (TIGR01451 family)